MLTGKCRMWRRSLTQVGKIGLSFGFVSLQYPNGPSVALLAVHCIVVGILAVILEDKATELALDDSLDRPSSGDGTGGEAASPPLPPNNPKGVSPVRSAFESLMNRTLKLQAGRLKRSSRSSAERDERQNLEHAV